MVTWYIVDPNLVPPRPLIGELCRTLCLNSAFLREKWQIEVKMDSGRHKVLSYGSYVRLSGLRFMPKVGGDLGGS